MNHNTDNYPRYAKIIHLGMAFFGIAAYLTAELAEDSSSSLGYLLHAYLGLSLAVFLLLRISFGFTPSSLSFKGWHPFSRHQLKLTVQDIGAVFKLRMPERKKHQGLAGLTQAFGLVLFTWMAITGTGLFILGNETDTNIFEFIEEAHEVGESLIPLYLALHIGAVILHTLCGHPVWKKMFAVR